MKDEDKSLCVGVPQMYVWNSQAMADWGRGKIGVIATSVAEARAKAERLFMEVVKLRDISGYWWAGGFGAEGKRVPEDTDWDLLEELYDAYIGDLSCEPSVSTDEIFLVRGSA